VLISDFNDPMPFFSRVKDSIKNIPGSAAAGEPISSNWWWRVGSVGAVVCAGAAAIGVLLFALALALAYPNLPSIDSLTDYRPKIPLRVYTADGVLIGEFGEERRNVVRIAQVPMVLKQAVLAAEDDRFYQHSGIDYFGIVRAAVTNIFTTGRRQGASTITQQVARNFFLSSEQSYVRKVYEILLAFQIESKLTKDQILEVYFNQIYLGQRAYGFASAARIYFGKSLSDITPAEAAMLAGLPKAPSAYNPVVNPMRAKVRQQYVLTRMNDLGYLDDAAYKKALAQTLSVKAEGAEFAVRAEYAAEMARQIVYEQYREETYTRGLSVYTTLRAIDQDAAYRGLRAGVMDYVRRHGYGGPDAFIELPADRKEMVQVIEDALLDYPDSDNIVAAVVLEASLKIVKVWRQGEIIDITGEGLKFASFALSTKATPAQSIRRGAIVRVTREGKGPWEITQMPHVESAFVAADVNSGAVHALVGGFDFSRNKFNHVMQAWRQPGSSFKPFIYSAALERGFSPATVVNDAPIIIDAAQTGSQTWKPKNYDGKFEGPMRLRTALAKSKNMVSIRILQTIGPKYVQDYIKRFGFEPAKHPAYLPMALGAGSVTPWQMLGAFSVFANGGYKINPYLIGKITDSTGKVLAEANPVLANQEENRVLDVRNAYVMDSLLQEVVRSGTAAKALSLQRGDLRGKTGTTNDSHDAWFAGYSNENVAGIAWIGFDQPRSLGDRETGGGLALPIWISYMSTALKGVPEKVRVMPEGLVHTNGDIYYVENVPRPGQAPSTGATDPATLTPAGVNVNRTDAAAEARDRIYVH
jgi:penicillin-binding protein 1A